MGKQNTKSTNASKGMTPEQFFQMSKISSDITTRAGVKTPEEALEVKKKQLAEIQKRKKVTPIAVPVTEQTLEMPIEQKVSLVAKGMVYINWVVTLLFSAVLILIAILYPFPFNIVIIGMAFGMDVITWWTMRRYMK